MTDVEEREGLLGGAKTATSEQRNDENVGKESLIESIMDSPNALIGWYSMLNEQFGSKLLILLFTSQHMVKGLANSFSGEAARWIFKSYNVPGPHTQVYSGVIGLPWALKPIIGMISDICPIKGYNKAPYILVSSILGVCGFAMVGMGSNDVAINITVMMMFLCALQASTCDLLTEAKYAEALNNNPKYGPDLMTYVWSGINVAGIIALIGVGWMISSFGPRVPYMVAIVPAASILYPVYKNYLQETPRSAEEQEAVTNEMMEQKEAFFLCILMLVSTVFLTVIGMAFESNAAHFYGVMFVMVVILSAFSITLRPVIAKINAFFLVQTSLGIGIDGATFYFYTDTAEQYPDGPHFSVQFFTTVLGLVTSLFSLAGLFLYNKHMKDWNYRTLLMVTNLLISILSFLDIIMFTRTNVKLGIPDTLFVLGSSVSGTVISQWQWMPGVVLLSQMCPKGMEATMYALLAGCHNLGNTLSAYLGAYILELLNINPAGLPNEAAQFDNLWVASLIATILPTLTLILIPFLIPDKKQTDRLLDEDDRSATAGSLWNKWNGNDTHSTASQA
jgi:folate/biopterin transporter